MACGREGGEDSRRPDSGRHFRSRKWVISWLGFPPEATRALLSKAERGSHESMPEAPKSGL